MSEVNGINYQKTQNNPPDRIRAGELNSRIYIIREKFTLSAVLAINDIILAPILPEGALVINAKLWADNMGGAGRFTFGHKASDDASIAEDLDAFVSEVDAGAAAAKGSMDHEADAGAMKRFDKPVQLVVEVTEATTNAVGDVEMFIEYTKD